MPRSYSTSRRYPVFLALLCAILAVLLVVELTTESGDLAEAPPAKPQPRKPGQEAETQSGFVMPPEDTYAEVSERPLFFRSRRPLPPEVVTKEETPADTSRAAFILSGVVLTGTQRMALLQSQSSPKIARVEEGQEYEGWTVEAIHPNKVVVRRGQEVSEIVLEDRARTAPPRDRRSARKRTKPKQPPENEDESKKRNDE
jgi:type II secretory pathway component PulC